MVVEGLYLAGAPATPPAASRESSMAPNRYWFAPKTYGYGSGLPIRWEGWAVLLGFFVLTFADLRLAPAPSWRAVGLVLLVAAFAAVCAWKTEGGWRWRWGGE
jgi:hypothetical protein